MGYSFKSPKAAKIFQQAADLHIAGQLDAAEEKYRKILKLDPANYDCLHLLGVIRLQQGRPEDAVEILRNALRRRPKAPDAHYNLGVVLKDLRRHDEAEACFRNALQLKPDYVEALTALGATLNQQGRIADAAECYGKAVALKPDDAEAQNALGGHLVALGRFEEALAAIQKAIALKPDYAEAHSNQGDALQSLGRSAEAVACYQRALALKPDYVEAENNLGATLADLNRIDEAVAHYRRSLELRPDYPDAHNNLGIIVSAQGRLGEAEALYRRALALRPSFPEAHSNLGLLLADRNQYDDALDHYRQALALRPDYADAHFNEALAHLVLGDFAAGWEKYEWRWRTKPFIGRWRSLPRPQWQGEDLAGKTLLLHAEQGLGDTLQFLRYLPLVAARAERLVLEIQAPILPLLDGISGVTQLATSGQPELLHDLHCPLMSLPRIFGTRLDNIPAPAKELLRIPPQRLAPWQDALAAAPRPRIGLVWAGSRDHKKDRRRSLPLVELLPLLATSGVQLISLQKDPREGDAAILQRYGIANLGERFADFADAAAVMSQLDLVITVDTSTAHLAGTLGVPCWLLLPFSPDWRWLLGREDSPWYPSLRLFRQQADGDWGDVVARVRNQIGSLAAAR